MIRFMETKERLKEVEKSLDSELWHACAGGMVQMPEVNSKVCYFPQGHAESACGPFDFGPYHKIPPFIQCRVAAIKFMADPDSDEVYAKLRLVPLTNSGANSDDDDDDDDDVGVRGINCSETRQNKPPSFAKTLTQSDANNGGGFSVPRYCADTIFPRLDYSADPPVQVILVKDVLGQTWKFRHIYRGTPKRHLLTTGWSNFVNHKRLVAGDSVVFLRAQNGDLCVGIRRAKKGAIGAGTEASSGWNPAGEIHHVSYGGFGALLGEGDSQFMRNGNGLSSSDGVMMGKGKVKSEEVAEAANLAANYKPFEVVYYPRAGTPEFCVKASLVREALQIRWCPGMRFKMPFEHEDSLRVSWSLGTITCVQVVDPTWPGSPWRILQVTWDEPELHQNVTRVSPWLVELVPNIPALNLCPFSPPRKKLRLPQHPDDFHLDGLIHMPTLPSNLVYPSNLFINSCLHEMTPAGMQGARHPHYGISLSDIHLNKLQSGLASTGFAPFHRGTTTSMKLSNDQTSQKPSTSEDVSCLLSMASSSQSSKKPDDAKTSQSQFVLFGQRILTEQQISSSSSADTVSPVLNGNCCAFDGNACSVSAAFHQKDHLSCEFPGSLETSECKIYMDSEGAGWSIDLSSLDSYDELNSKLADILSIQGSEILRRVVYHDVKGEVKHIGDEQFCEFARTTRKLTIMMNDSGCDNDSGGGMLLRKKINLNLNLNCTGGR